MPPTHHIRYVGGTSTLPVDSFVHRVTEATEFNTGAGLGVISGPYEGRETLPEHLCQPLDPVADAHNGNLTIAAGQTVTNKVIKGYVDMTNTSILRNCIVLGTASPPAPVEDQQRPLVKVIDHTPSVNGPRALLDFVTIEPQTKAQYWGNAIGYYGWEARRVSAQGTTDILAARSNSAGNGLANVRSRDSWYGPIVQWDPDLIYPRTGPYVGSHDDTVQLEGNTGGPGDIVFDGDTMVGRMMLEYGQPSADPQNWPSPTSCACIVASPNTKDRAAATFRYVRFYGGAPNQVNLGIESSLSEFVFEECLHERPGAPGVPAGYPSKALVIGTGTVRTVTNPRYMDNGALVPILAG